MSSILPLPPGVVGEFVGRSHVDLSRVTWVTDDEEHVEEFRPPSNVVAAPPGVSLAQLLGLTPGEEMAVVQSVPFGDPLVVVVRGMRLALRRSEAAWIRVE